MQQVFSPKQVARAIGASESSVKRWCDRGLLASVKTGGGHRRVPLSGVLEFIRSENRALVSPVELGLPTELAAPRHSITDAKEEYRKALEAGNYPICRRVLLSLFLARHTIAQICDNVLAPAMRSMGEGWCDGSVDVYEERRGCEITLRLVHDLRSMIPQPQPGAPLAIGGSVEGDPYTLPTRMVELVLLELGWNAFSLGCGVPLSSLKRAVEEKRPRLFWLSVSVVADPKRFVEEYAELYACCDGVAVALGGQCLDEALRAQLQYTTHCENLQRLETFAKALNP